MKKEYTKPMMIGEHFIANEYVSACFGIACQTGASNNGEGTFDKWGREHVANPDGTGCGHKDNQFIREVDTTNGITSYKITEVNTPGWGNLDTYFYPNDQYNNSERMSVVSGLQNGQTVYWTTQVGWVTMRHVGTVDLKDTTRPLHS